MCRDKNIDRELFLQDIELALLTAGRKTYGLDCDLTASVDRFNGQITFVKDGVPIAPSELGRIAAQTFRQVIIQKTREAERTSVYDDFIERKGTIITGQVMREDHGNYIVQIGRTEAFLPRSEQIPGETHNPSDRVRALILDVRETPSQVKIILSRSHPDMVRRLFEAEVPEVAERIIEIKALAREPGYRTKIAVSSIDSKVDAVGACVGVRGSRIKNIVEELGGEKIDIVRYNESSQILIANALKPAEVEEISLCFELGRATVVVREDQLSLAIGKRGQNVRLAYRLTNWDIDILTRPEFDKGIANLDRTLKEIEGVGQEVVDKVVAMGMVNVIDVEECGLEPLVQTLGVDQELAERIVSVCADAAARFTAEEEAEKAARAEAALRPPEPAAEPVAEGAEAAAGDSAPAGEDDVHAAGDSGHGEPRDLALAREASHGSGVDRADSAPGERTEQEEQARLAEGRTTIMGHRTLEVQAQDGALSDPDPSVAD